MPEYVTLVFEPQIDGSPVAQVCLHITTAALDRLRAELHPTETLTGKLQELFDKAVQQSLDPWLDDDE